MYYDYYNKRWVKKYNFGTITKSTGNNGSGTFYILGGGTEMEKTYRIRKLTPKECGRLMGVSDDDITKMLEVNSNSQCYKQFGNSIVVDVMSAMFSQLGIPGVKKWNEIHSEEVI